LGIGWSLKGEFSTGRRAVDGFQVHVVDRVVLSIGWWDHLIAWCGDEFVHKTKEKMTGWL
jgi:hypothetical protein